MDSSSLYFKDEKYLPVIFKNFYDTIKGNKDYAHLDQGQTFMYMYSCKNLKLDYFKGKFDRKYTSVNGLTNSEMDKILEKEGIEIHFETLGDI
jgi:S-adenosylmethionine hydrolase